MTFVLQDEFMQRLIQAQQAASSAITTAFSAVTPTELSSFSAALGPIAVANMIPAMYESTANNVMSGMLTATNHALLGVATHVSDAAHTAADAVDV
jgi:hypothetical protein